jgi:hypothetical protein
MVSIRFVVTFLLLGTVGAFVIDTYEVAVTAFAVSAGGADVTDVGTPQIDPSSFIGERTLVATTFNNPNNQALQVVSSSITPPFFFCTTFADAFGVCNSTYTDLGGINLLDTGCGNICVSFHQH